MLKQDYLRCWKVLDSQEAGRCLDHIITIIFYGAIKRSIDIITQKSKRFGLNVSGLRMGYELGFIYLIKVSTRRLVSY